MFPDLADYDDKWASAMTPILSTYYDHAGKQTRSRLGLDPDEWKVTDPHLQTVIRRAALAFCRETNATTQKDLDQALAELRKELDQGIVAGEPLEALTKRVKKVFTEAETWRARRIAQTESARAYHAAQELSGIDSGVVAGWEWLISSDACPLCQMIATEANKVPIQQAFAIVGRHQDYAVVRFPPLHPNCQCTVMPILTEEFGGPSVAWSPTLVQPKPGKIYYPPAGMTVPSPDPSKPWPDVLAGLNLQTDNPTLPEHAIPENPEAPAHVLTALAKLQKAEADAKAGLANKAKNAAVVLAIGASLKKDEMIVLASLFGAGDHPTKAAASKAIRAKLDAALPAHLAAEPDVGSVDQSKVTAAFAAFTAILDKCQNGTATQAEIDGYLASIGGLNLAELKALSGLCGVNGGGDKTKKAIVAKFRFKLEAAWKEGQVVALAGPITAALVKIRDDAQAGKYKTVSDVYAAVVAVCGGQPAAILRAAAQPIGVDIAPTASDAGALAKIKVMIGQAWVAPGPDMVKVAEIVTWYNTLEVNAAKAEPGTPSAIVGFMSSLPALYDDVDIYTAGVQIGVNVGKAASAASNAAKIGDKLTKTYLDAKAKLPDPNQVAAIKAAYTTTLAIAKGGDKASFDPAIQAFQTDLLNHDAKDVIAAATDLGYSANNAVDAAHAMITAIENAFNAAHASSVQAGQIAADLIKIHDDAAAGKYPDAASVAVAAAAVINSLPDPNDVNLLTKISAAIGVPVISPSSGTIKGSIYNWALSAWVAPAPAGPSLAVLDAVAKIKAIADKAATGGFATAQDAASEGKSLIVALALPLSEWQDVVNQLVGLTVPGMANVEFQIANFIKQAWVAPAGPTLSADASITAKYLFEMHAKSAGGHYFSINVVKDDTNILLGAFTFTDDEWRAIATKLGLAVAATADGAECRKVIRSWIYAAYVPGAGGTPNPFFASPAAPTPTPISAGSASFQALQLVSTLQQIKSSSQAGQYAYYNDVKNAVAAAVSPVAVKVVREAVVALGIPNTGKEQKKTLTGMLEQWAVQGFKPGTAATIAAGKPPVVGPGPPPAYYQPPTPVDSGRARGPIPAPPPPINVKLAPFDKDAFVNEEDSAGHPFPPDPDALKIVNRLGGSTGALLVEDPATGKRYVLKRGASADHVREEYATDRLYEQLGVGVPKAKLYETATGPVKLSEFLTGKDLGDLTDPKEIADAEEQIRKHFAVDCLLGNWDVIGLSRDNCKIVNGKVYRIDNGGGLRYRAQGQLKDAKSWNEYPTELWSMREMGTGQGVFGKLTIEDISKQIRAIQAAVPHLNVPTDLAETVGRRIEQLVDVANAAETLVADKFATKYADDFGRHLVGMREEGVFKNMARSFTKSGVTPTDENGKDWDDLRGPNSAANQLESYIQKIGGSLDTYDSWRNSQASSSWSNNSRALKFFVAKQRGGNFSEYFWRSGVADCESQYKSACQAAGGEDKYATAILAGHVFTYNTLTRIDFPRKDASRGVLRLVRTENQAVMQVNNLKRGDQGKTFPRGAAESFSVWQRISVHGSETTYVDMPIHRVLGTYWHGRGYNFNGTGFLGDGENEFVCDAQGVPIDYANGSDPHPIP